MVVKDVSPISAFTVYVLLTLLHTDGSNIASVIQIS